MKQIIIKYAVILIIGSEENSVVVYLTSETDSYYFSLAIWNSITKKYPNNYAYAIRHNVSIIIIINIIYANLDCHIIYYCNKNKL